MKNVKSAVRVFAVLEYFDDVREPRTLTEISRDLGMPMSSCIALLRSLESIDYMTFSPLTKKYLPSGRVQQLGSWLDDFIFSSGTIEKIAETVAKKTGETVIIATMNGLHAQYILRIQSQHPLPYSPVTGSRRPLLKSCAGLVLLAQQDDEFIDRVIIRVNGKAGANGERYDRDDIVARIKEIRATGYAFATNRIVEGAGMVAVSIPPIDGRPTLALGVGAPVNRLVDRVEEIVEIASETIAERLAPRRKETVETHV